MAKLTQKFIKAIKDPYWAFERVYVKNRNILKKYIPTRYKPRLKKIEYAVYLKLNALEQYTSLHLSKYLPRKKYQGNNNFTIVTAVYNVEMYLDDFFDSIVKQSLDFNKHIQIICVDDGSVDNSAKIIEKWHQKYPNNIHYYYKENGGQSSARNLGLQYVTTDWVTFIDPDDFINTHYFKEIDQAIVKDHSLAALVTNLIFYLENKKVLRDGHPLRYRFTSNKTKMLMKDLKDNINLSAASTVFLTKIIQNNQLKFDHRIKPNFEDGKFIADYFLLAKDDQKIQFLKEAKYFYRKRENGSSTLDGSWSKEEKYYDVLKYGFLSMLEEYQQKHGKIPYHIQRTALYDMAWYIVYLLNSSEKLAFLSANQKQQFQDLLENVFSYIDTDTILKFNLAGIWWFQKVGMLGLFKKEAPEKNIVYIENIDREKKQILLSYYTYFDTVDSIMLDEDDIVPVYAKTVENTFNDKLFAYEKRYWISYASADLVDKLKVFIDQKQSRLSLKNKHHMQVSINDILTAFTPSEKYKTDGSWLLMDRDIQADDNAEHLYRFIQKNHPEQKCYFALNKNSHDWKRLKSDGFDLIDFGSEDYENKLKRVSKIISSHLDRYITNYFGDEYEYSKKIVFLQHGVTKDNMSNWFNSKKTLRCLVTTTTAEYHSIIDNLNTYKLSNKDVVLTGFPRHDSLLKNNNLNNNVILIMPTWRQSIMGDVVGDGNKREINELFMASSYAKHWYSVLHSQELLDLVSKYNYRVIFAPHTNIVPYLPKFNVPDYIEVWRADNSKYSMQKLFQDAKLMITDYSSVAFEIALLEKTVLYYQFDRDEVFSAGHIYQKGYFSYEENGFGPVVATEHELFEELAVILNNNGNAVEPYKTRIQETFPFRDGKNCERVYQAIAALDKPDSQKVDIDILRNMVNKAYEYQAWGLLERRLSKLIEICDETEYDKSLTDQMLFESLVGLNKFNEADVLLDSLSLSKGKKAKYKATIAFAENAWEDAVKCWESVEQLSIDEQIKLLKSYAKLGMIEKFESLVSRLSLLALTASQEIIIDLLSDLANSDWIKIINKADLIETFSCAERINYQPKLILAEAYRSLEMFTLAYHQLLSFEKHTINSVSGRAEIAYLALAQEKYDKVIEQLDKAFGNLIFRMPEQIQNCYLTALRNTNRMSRLTDYLRNIPEEYSSDSRVVKLEIKNAFNAKKWSVIVDKANELSNLQRGEMLYEIATAYFKLGLLDDFKTIYQKPTEYHSYEYWELVLKFALITNDTELAEYCYKCYKNMAILLDNFDKYLAFSIFHKRQEK